MITTNWNRKVLWRLKKLWGLNKNYSKVYPKLTLFQNSCKKNHTKTRLRVRKKSSWKHILTKYLNPAIKILNLIYLISNKNMFLIPSNQSLGGLWKSFKAKSKLLNKIKCRCRHLKHFLWEIHSLLYLSLYLIKTNKAHLKAAFLLLNCHSNNSKKTESTFTVISDSILWQ